MFVAIFASGLANALVAMFVVGPDDGPARRPKREPHTAPQTAPQTAQTAPETGPETRPETRRQFFRAPYSRTKVGFFSGTTRLNSNNCRGFSPFFSGTIGLKPAIFFGHRMLFFRAPHVLFSGTTCFFFGHHILGLDVGAAWTRRSGHRAFFWAPHPRGRSRQPSKP